MRKTRPRKVNSNGLGNSVHGGEIRYRPQHPEKNRVVIGKKVVDVCGNPGLRSVWVQMLTEQLESGRPCNFKLAISFTNPLKTKVGKPGEGCQVPIVMLLFHQLDYKHRSKVEGYYDPEDEAARGFWRCR